LKTMPKATIVFAVLLLILSLPTQCFWAFPVPSVKADEYNPAFGYYGNQCLNFTVANQRVDCGQHLIYQSTKLTVEAWVKPEFNVEVGSYPRSYSAQFGTIACLRPYGAGGGWWFGFYYPTGKLYFIMDAVDSSYGSNTQIWYNDSWYYLAVTYDPTLSENNLVFYVNGTVDSYHNVTTTIAYSAPTLQIGSQGDGTIWYLGLVDEVRLWNVSRTQSEIQQWWDRTEPNGTAASPNLVGYWRFDYLSRGNYPDNSRYGDDAVPTVPPQSAAPGAPIYQFYDVNFDGKCDGRDITIVAKAFGSHGPSFDYPGEPASPAWNPLADLNEDGKVDGRDITLVAHHYGGR